MEKSEIFFAGTWRPIAVELDFIWRYIRQLIYFLQNIIGEGFYLPPGGGGFILRDIFESSVGDKYGRYYFEAI